MNEIKKLGFGMMRLPKKLTGIDIEQVKEMVDLFSRQRGSRKEGACGTLSAGKLYPCNKDQRRDPRADGKNGQEPV